MRELEVLTREASQLEMGEQLDQVLFNLFITCHRKNYLTFDRLLQSCSWPRTHSKKSTKK